MNNQQIEKIDTIEKAMKFLGRKPSQIGSTEAYVPVELKQLPYTQYPTLLPRAVDLSYPQVKELTSRDIWLIFSGVSAKWCSMTNQPFLWDWLLLRNAKKAVDKDNRSAMEYCELMYTTLMHHHDWVPLVLPQDLENSVAKVKKVLQIQPWDFRGLSQLPATLTLIAMIDVQDLDPVWRKPGTKFPEQASLPLNEKVLPIVESILVVTDALNTVMEREEAIPWDQMDFKRDPAFEALSETDKAKFDSIMQRIEQEKAEAKSSAK